MDFFYHAVYVKLPLNEKLNFVFVYDLSVHITIIFNSCALINYNQMIPQHNHMRAQQLANNDPFSSQSTKSNPAIRLFFSHSSFKKQLHLDIHHREERIIITSV